MRSSGEQGMQRSGVITGDIVGSSQIDDRNTLLDALHGVLDVLARQFAVRSDVYRGDEFQALIPNPAHTTLAALLIRARIIALSPSKKQPWDARISMGVGRVDSLRERLGESSGEAFTLSGRGLEAIKKSDERLSLLAGSADITRQLSLLTRMADDIITHWSHYSGEVAYFSLLYNESQQALAKRLGRSQPTINTRLVTAKLALIRAYVDYTDEILSKDW
ncbi:MAG: hypothetical protein QNJ78_06605 [Gammaproteobacteria bacterium]|nr:hypothetical protein [Gammaproteobacteria bacterium]